jgi:large subunit ribosomal protein L4e
MTNTDLARIINSEEVQKQLRRKGPKKSRRAPIKKNPLKNSQVMIRLNPYWQTFKRQQYLLQQRRLQEKAAKKGTVGGGK